MAETIAMFPEVEPVGSAAISACGLYRYTCPRRWSPGRVALWIMLNPSKADGQRDDPTMTRVIGFSRDAGYGASMVGNLYAWRSFDPADLAVPGRDIIGPDNDATLQAMLAKSDAVICAWGASFPRGGKARAAEVLQMVRDSGHEPLALRVTKGGQPTHPLYLPASLRPRPLSELLDSAWLRGS